MDNLKNKLSADEKQLNDEELLRYLRNDLEEEEKNILEKKIENDSFESEALQGLLQIQDKESLKKNLNYLNKKLRQLTSKKQRREKRKIIISEWILLTIIFLLFICVITYFIISGMK